MKSHPREEPRTRAPAGVLRRGVSGLRRRQRRHRDRRVRAGLLGGPRASHGGRHWSRGWRPSRERRALRLPLADGEAQAHRIRGHAVGTAAGRVEGRPATRVADRSAAGQGSSSGNPRCPTSTRSCFSGFTVPEIAAMKQVSERTVERRWQKARLFLVTHTRSESAPTRKTHHAGVTGGDVSGVGGRRASVATCHPTSVYRCRRG